MDFGYTRLRTILYGKYHDNTWLIQSLIYMVSRYHPLEDRLIETFRYVECDRDNSYTFSYEFGSILRDVGSTFGSVLDTLVRNSENRSPNERLDISDYRTWLKTEIDNIYLITAGVTTPRAGRYVIPFSSWESSESRLQWWDSYNNVKHLDIERDITIDASNWGTVKTTAYGKAIEKVVLKFYNLYNPEDNVFQPNAIYPFYPFQIYPAFEGDLALGQNGYQTVPDDILPSLPENYIQTNVQNEILPLCDADADGSPDWPLFKNLLVKKGDNHVGYFGFRDSVNHTRLLDDGAINIVVDN